MLISYIKYFTKNKHKKIRKKIFFLQNKHIYQLVYKVAANSQLDL